MSSVKVEDPEDFFLMLSTAVPGRSNACPIKEHDGKRGTSAVATVSG